VCIPLLHLLVLRLNVGEELVVMTFSAWSMYSSTRTTPTLSLVTVLTFRLRPGSRSVHRRGDLRRGRSGVGGNGNVVLHVHARVRGRADVSGAVVGHRSNVCVPLERVVVSHENDAGACELLLFKTPST
jgi:hypothetical protein